jgi:hypothetical protein
MADLEAAGSVPGQSATRAPGSSVDLAVVGHVGLATDLTAAGTTVVVGGAGYSVAAAAAAILGSRVGLAAQVGPDFELSVLTSTALNLDEVSYRAIPGRYSFIRVGFGGRGSSAP